MKPRILLVNPPVYDFTAYDFWLQPYGMLRVAGQLRQAAQLTYFNYLTPLRRNARGQGKFPATIIPKPALFADIPRFFRRFGKPRQAFLSCLQEQHFDLVMIQTVMTYWYLGVREVIEDVRRLQPWARIVLGGVYATLCPDHARTLGADFVQVGPVSPALSHFLGIELTEGLPFWEGTGSEVGVIKLTEGCPFRCTYCAVPHLYPRFVARPTNACLEELRYLLRCGVRHVAFYDDALLFQPEQALIPFLEGVLREGLRVTFHTPNALNARFLTPEIAALMVRAGCQSFYLGFESGSYAWQRKTGGKVYGEEFRQAVHTLRSAGAPSITAYIILGHPDSEEQEVEASIEMCRQEGVRVMLSEFAPVPGTVDGEKCRQWVDLAEPLNHNKTAFTIRRLGWERVNALKALSKGL
ncbi:MAG: radical SAM protein [Nitrospinota bacterium]|nr:MAG: radical SAM protein [Nitrospinota bacterium]